MTPIWPNMAAGIQAVTRISPEKIVSMLMFQNKLYIATEHRVFVSVDGGETFKPVEFESLSPKA